jgi:N-acetyl-beta-hexosaminidase
MPVRPGLSLLRGSLGVFGPVFDPTRPEVYRFFDKFFKEMARLFPDPYLHIGGDEVEAKQWKENPKIQAFMKKHNLPDNHALQAYFNREILKILTRYHKKMVGWDEIYQPGLPKDIVIQSWRGTQALVDGAKKGYQGLLSNGYYIDLCETAERHYLNDPIPPDSPLSESEKKLILGGEATMWAELISPETIDSRIWPRTAAIAERLWSPVEVRNVDDMYERLKVLSLQLEDTGLQHLKNQI